MPWSVGDVDSHKKGLTDKGKKQWVRIANSVLKRCMEKGGSEKECAASAIRQANGVVNNVNAQQKYSVYKSKQKLNYEPKLTIHQEKAHLVIPVVMMVEGVHNGSQGAVYHSIQELGKFPASWNGIPVVINHPMIEDEPVSANSPDIIDTRTVGRVYNTNIEGDRLKAEVWLDEDKLNSISSNILEDINNSVEVEVSLGVFTENEEKEGEWGGEKYIAIAKNHHPDHLALLPDAVGACSCEDGCGLGVNKIQKDMKIEEMLKSIRQAGFAVNQIGNNKGKEEGFRARLDAAYNALRELDSNESHYLEELYDTELIFSKYTKEGTQMFKQGYEFSDGKIKLTGKPVEVRREVKFVSNKDIQPSQSSGEAGVEVDDKLNNLKTKEVKIMSKECTPCVKKKVDELIANSQGRWTEDDREFLQDFPEDKLDKLTPIVTERIVEKEVQVNVLSKEDQDALTAYKLEKKEKREQLMKDIQTNSTKELWPDDVLNGMTDDHLKRLFDSVKKENTVDYSLRGAEVQTYKSKVRPMPPTGIEFKTTK